MNQKEQTLQQARMLYETVRKLQRSVGSRMLAATALPEMDFTVTQLNVIMVVHAHQPITVKHLAEQLGVSPASASAMVDRLVELGALSREQCAADRRQVAIAVTDQATEALVHCQAHILGLLQQLLERIGPELAQQWCTVYERLSQILDEGIELNTPILAASDTSNEASGKQANIPDGS